MQASELAHDIQPLAAGAPRAAAIAGGVGLAGVVAGVFFGATSDGWDQFFRSYLLNYVYVVSLVLGALFFVLLQHLTRAGWSVAVRRLAEHVMAAAPLAALLFLPLLVPLLRGMGDLYPWTAAGVTDPDSPRFDPLIAQKAAYLNVPFFLVRCAVYFAVWIALARYYASRSLAQDTTGDARLTARMQAGSAPGMLLYALSVTFFSIDALMSLNPHWFSTIWGVYFFSGCTVGFFALLAILIFGVQQAGRLRRTISEEHYHDVGKLAFGFVVFWAYIAFSQYMLIWYGNLPEETVWYQVRQAGDWWVGVSLVLLFGHFFVPFLAIMSRYPKRRPRLLVAVAVWLLLLHWVDLYYVVMARPHGTEAPAAGLHASDGALFVGLTGLLIWAVVRRLGRHALLPAGDPWLHEALAHENV